MCVQADANMSMTGCGAQLDSFGTRWQRVLLLRHVSRTAAELGPTYQL